MHNVLRDLDLEDLNGRLVDWREVEFDIQITSKMIIHKFGRGSQSFPMKIGREKYILMIDYRFAKAGAMWYNVFHLTIAHFVCEGDAINSKSNLWVYKEEDIDIHMENVWQLPKKHSIVIRDLEDWTVFDNQYVWPLSSLSTGAG